MGWTLIKTYNVKQKRRSKLIILCKKNFHSEKSCRGSISLRGEKDRGEKGWNYGPLTGKRVILQGDGIMKTQREQCLGPRRTTPSTYKGHPVAAITQQPVIKWLIRLKISRNLYFLPWERRIRILYILINYNTMPTNLHKEIHSRKLQL